MSPTLHQLSKNIRRKRPNFKRAPSFDKAPNRRGVIYKIAVTSPRKPNSGRRVLAKVRLVSNGKRVFAKIPGIGPHFLQSHSVVFLRGHGPKDTPGVNYQLVRGKYDFNKLELYGRRKRRSKFAVKKYV